MLTYSYIIAYPDVYQLANWLNIQMDGSMLCGFKTTSHASPGRDSWDVAHRSAMVYFSPVLDV